MTTSDRQQVGIRDLPVGCDLLGREIPAGDKRDVISQELVPRHPTHSIQKRDSLRRRHRPRDGRSI